MPNFYQRYFALTEAGTREPSDGLKNKAAAAL
jgi:hypothetical protein